MPKEKANIHNTLNINVLPLHISGGKEKDYTYSIHLSKLLRRLVRIAVPDIEHLTFSDIELLDDVMRFGNLSKVAKLHGCSQSTVSVHLRRILDTLEESVSNLEAAKTQLVEQERIADLEQQLDKAHKFSRRLVISSARDKSMTVEAHLREHKKN